ncbi:MAG: C4-dicarboxylate-specific signal transduction histidine kinase [Sulfurimonas sp.]|uniref:PAS domain-containing sensor histidine kinase n=1 Tax=Sulfurimonas sp. TaxID=2022749 RepID=UPI0039E65BAE
MNSIDNDTLKLIVDNSNIGICILDKDASFVDCSQQFLEILSITKDELVVNGLSVIFLDEYIYTLWYEFFFMKLGEEEPINDEYTFINSFKESLLCKFLLKKDISSGNIVFSIEDISMQKQQERNLKIANEEIESLLKTKQNHLESAMKKNELIKTQDSLMLNQAKLASMGEMIGAIAHQWKQPLGKINSIIIDIASLYSDTKHANLLSQRLDQIENLTAYMADTIEDFRNYINPNNYKNIFTFRKVLNDALNIFSSTIQSDKIKIETDFIDEITLFGYKKEFIQVLLIFFNNAKDSFKNNKVKNPIIEIITEHIDDKKIIRIRDNGGGIEQDTLVRVFEPYFSTKKHMGGTGLGLYMAKVIIEDSMHGILDLTSEYEFTEVRIVLLGDEK